MAESSLQNPLLPNLTPKEELVTLNKPESPNPFLPTIQVLPDSKIWVSTPKGEVKGEIGITTFRNALRAQYLPHLSMYVPPPSITTVRPWFAMIGYNGEIRAKGTLRKICLPPRWRLLMQAAGGLTSLGDTNVDGAHPQLSSGSNLSVLVDKTKSAKDGLKTAHTTSGANKESRGADDILRKVKLEDLSNILKDTRYAFFTPDSPTDEPIIVSDVSSLTSVSKGRARASKVKAEDEVASMKAKPSYLDINQLTELLVNSLKPELSKILTLHDFPSCLPTELKDLPSKIIGLSGEIKVLKQHIKDMEIELPVDLIEIPTKLESFTSTISSLSSQVAELKNIQWKPPAEFSIVMNNASGAASMDVPSAGQAPPSPAEGEKNTKYASTNLKNELIDLLGKDVVTQYYTKKLHFDKYCDTMLKRKENLKITNCEVLTKKGPITLKIYKEDGSEEVISNLKTRVDQLTQTEQELKIDLNQPLKEQDPLDELTDLANKKRKRTSDLRDHSSLSASVAELPSASALQVLRRLGSIFTLVYATKVYKAGKRLLYVKRNKAISLGNATSKVVETKVVAGSVPLTLTGPNTLLLEESAEELSVSLMTTSFDFLAFLVEQAFKIDLMVFGPVIEELVILAYDSEGRILPASWLGKMSPTASENHGLSTLSLDTLVSSAKDLSKTESFCLDMEFFPQVLRQYPYALPLD
ncbi:hypothetical protein Tco_0798122 [Tanacetum coccineum]